MQTTIIQRPFNFDLEWISASFKANVTEDTGETVKHFARK